MKPSAESNNPFYLIFLLWKFVDIEHHYMWNFTPGWNFKISIHTEKNWCYTWVLTQGKMNIYLFHFTLGWKYICKDLRHFLQKYFTEKAVSYAVTGLYKNYNSQQEN